MNPGTLILVARGRAASLLALTLLLVLAAALSWLLVQTLAADAAAVQGPLLAPFRWQPMNAGLA